GELILPDVEIYEKEIGEPYYWLEYYCSPEMLGSEDEWNASRWVDQGDGHRLDLTGSYPKNGRYEPLLRLSNLGEEYEEYRPLNDNNYDWIRSMLQGDQVKLGQALREQRERFREEADEVFENPEINKEVEWIKKHKHSV